MAIKLQKLLLVIPAARRLREQLHNYDAEVRRLRSELQNSNTFLAEKSARLEQCLRQNAFPPGEAPAGNAGEQAYADLLSRFHELEAAYKTSVQLNTELLNRINDSTGPAAVPTVAAPHGGPR